MAKNETETKSTTKGTKAGEERATFIIKMDLLEKMKNIAYWDRLKIKDVMEAALTDYFAKYEKKNGAIKERQRTE